MYFKQLWRSKMIFVLMLLAMILNKIMLKNTMKQHISTALYRYMCFKVVGTEDHVKQFRLMNAVRDNLLSDSYFTYISSGSFGEGLEMRGSDFDAMYVFKDMFVNNEDPKISLISMETDDEKPGYTKLLLSHREWQYCKLCEQLDGKNYLSSALMKQSDVHKGYIIHGPCLSDKDGFYDIAISLHCKTWIPSVEHWIKRANNSWPSNDVKQSILKHGVLFVPIGIKGSPKENVQWRISFSVGEKLLMNTFKHSQLICYALLKIMLKDVIATYSGCKELLCSYFLKTIMFWISEEQPQSVWSPVNLINCFMRCFNRLIYCVDYSVCQHYFIPENNMFENKIVGRSRELLLENLYTLQSYDWRCILFSDQLSEFGDPMWSFNVEPYLMYANDIHKTICFIMLGIANGDVFNAGISDRTFFDRAIQHTIACYHSSIKTVYTFYMSLWCSGHAQSIQLNSMYKNNKFHYGQYNKCLSTVLQNIYHDAVSGWLTLASFFYKTKQYNKALHIIMYTISKFSSEKLNTLDIYHRLIQMKLLKKKRMAYLWKIFRTADILFIQNSSLIPNELLMEVEDGRNFIPSIAYANFLAFLCNYHVNNTRQCQNSLQELQLVIADNYIIRCMSSKARAYNILGIALQLLGATESARQAYLKSIQLDSSVWNNSALNRLF